MIAFRHSFWLLNVEPIVAANVVELDWHAGNTIERAGSVSRGRLMQTTAILWQLHLLRNDEQ